MRSIEFFSGIGGFRVALPPQHEVVAAFDLSEPANRTYALNYGCRPITKNLATIKLGELAAFEGELWVMSPPCQPFCSLGRNRDLDDPRCRALLNLMELLPAAAPQALVLENVAGFQGSRAHNLLLETLSNEGYSWAEHTICPTMFGVPNRRLRYYLAATRTPIAWAGFPAVSQQKIMTYLDAVEDESLYVPAAVLDKHGAGFDVVVPSSERSACFIGNYGQLYNRSGSYLRTDRGVRLFSPSEIARLHGFPAAFHFPPELSPTLRYRLIGNSLNLTVARWVLEHVL